MAVFASSSWCLITNFGCVLWLSHNDWNRIRPMGYWLNIREWARWGESCVPIGYPSGQDGPIVPRRLHIWNFPFGWTWEWTVNQKLSYLTLIWSTERVREFCCQLCILLLLWCKSQKVWSPILSKQISRWLYFYLFYFQGFKRIQTEIILIGLVRGFLLQWFSLVAKLKCL